MTIDRVALMRRVRAAFNLNQPELAGWMGFNTRPWQRKEQGTSPIRDSEIYALAARCSGITSLEQAQNIIEMSCRAAEALQANKKGRK